MKLSKTHLHVVISVPGGTVHELLVSPEDRSKWITRFSGEVAKALEPLISEFLREVKPEPLQRVTRRAKRRGAK